MTTGAEVTKAERLNALFDAHGRFVYRTARRLGVPAREVDDITQEVFVVAYQKLDAFDGRYPRGWLFRIAVGVVSDFRKRAHTRREDLDTVPPEPRSAPSDDQEYRVWSRQLRALLDEALDELKDEEREVFVLYQLEGLSMRECGEILGCPEQTGYSRLRTARQKLQRQLRRRLELTNGSKGVVG